MNLLRWIHKRTCIHTYIVLLMASSHYLVDVSIYSPLECLYFLPPPQSLTSTDIQTFICFSSFFRFPTLTFLTLHSLYYPKRISLPLQFYYFLFTGILFALIILDFFFFFFFYFPLAIFICSSLLITGKNLSVLKIH